MSLRNLSVVSIAALSLLLTACPIPNPTADGNNVDMDASNPLPRDACSGGCAANQKCNIDTRQCEDACGGCDGGTCVKVMDDVFQCRPVAVSCSGNLCEPGQIACLGGECACLSSLSGALDTCQAAGKWCNGKACNNPRSFQECRRGDLSSPCPSGFLCQPVFGEDLSVCTRGCTDSNACQRGELCWSGMNAPVGGACLPSGLFGLECSQNRMLADGGIERNDAGEPLLLTVTAGNTCLLTNSQGEVTEAPGKGTGNCSYAIFQFWSDGVYPSDTCRPPGNATEGQPCRDDFSNGSIATQCATGLQCAKTKGGDDGICLRMCNAQPPALGFPPQPECQTGEACVNMLRYTDPNSNAVLGACMKKCDVFDPMKNTCANVGANPTSCVPTEASGELVVSLTGEGICIPQRPTIAATNATCAETDAFRGAACGSAEICTSLNADVAASCTAVCDVDCNPTDGGTGPARCATQPSARCSGGKTCKRVTSTTGARVGFCL